MRYFVTGGTGFIGSIVVKQLREAGHDVVALVRSPEKALALRDLGAEIAQGDITKQETLRDPMDGADGVFHIAGWYKIGVKSNQAEAINVQGTRNVLTTMMELGIPKGVYTSTLAVNSDTGGALRDETYHYDGPHHAAYDATKWRAHYEIAMPLIEQGLPLVIVMPGVVYGPGNTSLLGAHLQRALAGERVLLPSGQSGAGMGHVEDIACAHVLAMERGIPGETYIITGSCHTHREAFETAAQVTGKNLKVMWLGPTMLQGSAKIMDLVGKVVTLPPEYTAEAMRTVAATYFGDNSKAKRDLGYTPRSLEQGLRDTFATS